MPPAITPIPNMLTVAAARVAMSAALLSIGFLLLLHVLSPEFDPAHRMVSEYALGRHRWAIAGMFVGWSVSGIALAVALRFEVSSVWARLGLVLLVLSSVGALLGAIFGNPTDPRHGFAFALGVPTLPLAALLLSTALRHGAHYATWSRGLRIAGHLPWVSLAIMVLTIVIGLKLGGGKWTPAMPIGWPNRLLVVAYNAWMAIAAWCVLQSASARMPG